MTDDLERLFQRADFGRLAFVQTDEDYGYIDDDNRAATLVDGISVDCGLALVAAVNAVPELLALREEVGRLREALTEVTQCFYAASAEGLEQKLWGDGHQYEVGDLHDLVIRRLIPASVVAEQALARAALNQEGGQ